MKQNKSFVILASFLTAVVIISGIALTAAKPENVPKYKLWISTKTIVLGEAFDVWVYVTNPSDPERDATGPLHNVEVEYLTVNCTILGGWFGCIFRPDGTVEDLETGEIEYRAGSELRWDATVHPGETSLVFYVGWRIPVSEIQKYTYELTVEYEGTTYKLAETFKIHVNELS